MARTISNHTYNFKPNLVQLMLLNTARVVAELIFASGVVCTVSSAQLLNSAEAALM